MRNYVCFSQGTCYHCNTLKQHFLSWETLIDPHHCSGWINIKMTSQCIFCSSRSFTTHSPKSPYICPASLLLPLSVSLALHLSHTRSPACMCAIYQTLLPSLCPVSSPSSLLSWVVKTWLPEVGGRQKGPGVCSDCFGSESVPVWRPGRTLSPRTETINTAVCTTKVMKCLDGKQVSNVLRHVYWHIVISIHRILSICLMREMNEQQCPETSAVSSLVFVQHRALLLRFSVSVMQHSRTEEIRKTKHSEWIYSFWCLNTRWRTWSRKLIRWKVGPLAHSISSVLTDVIRALMAMIMIITI